MGLLGNLFGGGAKEAGEGVKSALDGVSDLANGIRSAISGDLPSDLRAQLEQKTM